jgi:hypothetical protein
LIVEVSNKVTFCPPQAWGLVKIKMQWGEKTFIVWTDMTNIN